MWHSEKMTTFQDFLRHYNNKDVVPTLQALNKMAEFYHNKNIDFSKVGCTLPSLANRVLHTSTNAKFYTFGEEDKELHTKFRENIVGGPSIVFTRVHRVGGTFIRFSKNVCQAIHGIDASQLYPYAMC